MKHGGRILKERNTKSYLLTDSREDGCELGMDTAPSLAGKIDPVAAEGTPRGRSIQSVRVDVCGLQHLL